MRVVLETKLVLAENLTQEQARALYRKIYERDKTKRIFTDTIYVESHGPMLWRLTMPMSYAKDFIQDPHAFIFEV